MSCDSFSCVGVETHVEGQVNQRWTALRAQPIADEDRVDILCEHRGQALSDFLRQMKEHNADVVRPSSTKKHRRAVARKSQLSASHPFAAEQKTPQTH